MLRLSPRITLCARRGRASGAVPHLCARHVHSGASGGRPGAAHSVFYRGEGPLDADALAANGASRIRDDFIAYFVARGHVHVPSSSLVPTNDPTLLFTNAGMVQFKDYFLGLAPPPHRRAVTAQRCLRAGGKHNDLDNVGYTPRHHTFFEMLGNFSFGDYFKAEAVPFAWEYLVGRLKLPSDRIRVTVYDKDDETYALWRDKVGIPESQIVRMGAATNFWSMGDGPGPCGPCTEILWDLRNGRPLDDDDRWLELWNVVFMEFQRASTGDSALSPLQVPCIDTGMGLERIAAVLQGAQTNFETDVLRTLVRAAGSLFPAGSTLAPGTLNVIADHTRAVGNLIADGVVPSNVGRGYVLRRIMRRASALGAMNNLREPFLHRLLPALAEASDPETRVLLTAQSSQIADIIRIEEESFGTVLKRGIHALNKAIGDATEGVLPAKVAFHLQESLGMPLDITRTVARQRGLSIDESAVEVLANAHRYASRSAVSKAPPADGARAASNSPRNSPDPSIAGIGGHRSAALAVAKEWAVRGLTSVFVGYDAIHGVECTVLAAAPNATEPGSLVAMVDRNPFYAAGGGQVSDTGALAVQTRHSAEVRFRVVEVLQASEGGTLLKLMPENDQLFNISEDACAALVLCSGVASVDAARRARIASHHTATHIVHAVLMDVLGLRRPGVGVQAGSHVDQDGLRFDFSHSKPLKMEDIVEIERRVNDIIEADLPVATVTVPIADARAAGAVAAFGEKYGSAVRMVSVNGCSRELCGGTHAKSTGDLRMFRIISESAVAAGTRRLQAVCGRAAINLSLRQAQGLAATAMSLKSSADVGAVLGAVEALSMRLREARQAAEMYQRRLAVEGNANMTRGEAARLMSGRLPDTLGGLSVEVRCMHPDEDTEFLRERMVALCASTQPSSVHILVAGQRVLCCFGEHVTRVNALTKSALTPTAVMKRVFEGCGVQGGGHPIAQGKMAVDADAWMGSVALILGAVL